MKTAAGLSAELVARQRELASAVDRNDRLAWPPARVAAVDCAFPERGRLTRAAAVVVRFPDLVTESQAVAECPTRLPYTPGLLSFRELPAILAALARLPATPDVVLCDGQGIAHPRRFGVACHLGVETGLPSVGVGKSRLCGDHPGPGRTRGSAVALIDRGEEIGKVVRTRTGVRPLYVSIGHRVSLDRAVELVLACATRYRLPEPIRAADRLAAQSSATCSR
ncbi:deoxyribonuclease V [Wenzhouxiangella sp. AB-CW3]|uniref:deoxyribonuclease V n=1 Tax=Wenzhouxiangella sp. AB-CW3 TaxID=2771012 RepID=UPI00168A7F2D|nr:deoxyribonuclease V [Wenzhouxiangella sp. AB-CW3]QOC22949.1 deoxyribonuclease V [Wenzhouxiangella sp. AB-CW3]